MKLHSLIAAALAIHAAWLTAPSATGAPTASLERIAGYEQGKPLSDLIETRQAVFRDTNNETVRATRENELLAFIASDAHPQAKVIAIGWLGCLGSPASIHGLVAAGKTPELTGAVAMALERIPGPEAMKARGSGSAAKAIVNARAAEAAAFAQALDGNPADADALIASALRSENELLAGSALRRIRAGEGSPSLAPALLKQTGTLPEARKAALCEALATRPDAQAALRSHLLQSFSQADPDPQAVINLGRVSRAAELPLLLKLATDYTTYIP
jgi:hypothetical protein